MDGFLSLTPLLAGAQPAGTLQLPAAEPGTASEVDAKALFALLFQGGVPPQGQAAGGGAQPALAQAGSDTLLGEDLDSGPGETSEGLPMIAGLLPLAPELPPQVAPPAGGSAGAAPTLLSGAGLPPGARAAAPAHPGSQALATSLQALAEPAPATGSELIDGAALAALASGKPLQRAGTAGPAMGALSPAMSGKSLPGEGKDLPSWLQQGAFSAFLDGAATLDGGPGRTLVPEQVLAAAPPVDLEPLLPAAQQAALASAAPGGAGGQAQTAAELRAPSAPAPALPLYSPAGTPAWEQETAGQIRWMARQELSRAELLLHPAELGALEVRISTEEDRTTVSFVAQTPAARELLEQSLPRLRELLASGGLQLAHGDVSQRGADERQAQSSGAGAWPEARSGGEDEALAPQSMRAAGLRLIDHYV